MVDQIHPFNSTIGAAPITQYTHVRNKNSNTRGSSPNVVKVIFHTSRNCSKRKEFALFGREVPILKKGGIEENRCLIQ